MIWIALGALILGSTLGLYNNISKRNSNRLEIVSLVLEACGIVLITISWLIV